MSSYNKKNPESIQAMFNSIALGYDRTNAVLSFRLHKYWNSELVKSVLQDAKAEKYLDLCCGTGEIAYTYLKRGTNPHEVYCLDFSEEMLHCAENKLRKHLLSTKVFFLHADAQQIPLKDKNIDCITLAYGIRNIKDPQKCMNEAFRTLKSGGVFGILELTRPKNKILRFLHRIYLKTFVPILGKCFASNQEAYKYLCNSIQEFVDPNQLKSMLEQEGFVEVRQIPISLGIATIIVAKKI